MNISTYRTSYRGNKRGNLLLAKPESGLDNGLGERMLTSPLRQIVENALTGRFFVVPPYLMRKSLDGTDRAPHS